MRLKFYLIIIGFLLCVVGSFILFSDVVTYLILSLIISLVLGPVVDLLDRVEIEGFKIPRFVSVLVSFAILVLVFSLFTSLFVPLLSEQIAYVRAIDFDNASQIYSSQIIVLEDWLRNIGLWSSEGSLSNALIELINLTLKEIEYDNILNKLLGTTGSILISVLAISFISFFLLLKKGLLRDVLLGFAPNFLFEMLSSALFKIRSLLSKYFLGLLIQMSFVFVMVSFSLHILGFQYAFTVGVFVAVANLIPYVGPLLGIVFSFIVAITTTSVQLLDQTFVILLLLKLVTVFGLVQLIDNVALQPIIFSKSIKAHPLEIFVVIFIGAGLAGAVGMISAIPAYTICRVMVQEFGIGLKKYKVFNI